MVEVVAVAAVAAAADSFDDQLQIFDLTVAVVMTLLFEVVRMCAAW